MIVCFMVFDVPALAMALAVAKASFNLMLFGNRRPWADEKIQLHPDLRILIDSLTSFLLLSRPHHSSS